VEALVMRSFLWGCAAAVVLLVAVGIGSLAQQPYAITVQPGESIQAAINAAPAGAVITLASGEWQEALTHLLQFADPLTLGM
jgi:hypothetical protein